MRHSILFALGVSALVVGCGGGSSGVGTPSTGIGSGQSSQRTLSGRAESTNSSPLASVGVLVDGELLAITDARGEFLIQDPPLGRVSIELDGDVLSSTGSHFARLRFPLTIAPVGNTSLPTRGVLPELGHPDGGSVLVAVDAGGTGASLAPISAQASTSALGLSGPTGTVVLLAGAPAVTAVSVAVLPLDRDALPIPVADAGGGPSVPVFAFTVEPSNASFDAGLGHGLSATLPNTESLAIGTLVPIWYLDPTEGWIDLATQGIEPARVYAGGPDGTRLVARYAIRRGGTYVTVLPRNAACATTLEGRVLDSGGAPLADIGIVTSTGQTGKTDALGRFTLDSVASHALSSTAVCYATDLGVRLQAGVGFASATAFADLAAGRIMPGGVTSMGDIVLAVPNSGALSGRVSRNGAGVQGSVTLSGPSSQTLNTNADGRFFVTGLAPGAYSAWFTFAAPTGTRGVVFQIERGEIASIDMQDTSGSGGSKLTVDVLFDHDGAPSSPAHPADGARVLLVGTDAVSAAGISGICNAQGRISFEAVDGPFTATAQLDVASDPSLEFGTRLAASALDVTPVGSNLSLVIGGPLPAFAGRRVGGTVHGTVANVPALEPGQTFHVQMRQHAFLTTTQYDVHIDPLTGEYEIPAFAELDFDLVFVLVECPAAGRCFNPTPLSVQILSGLPPVAVGESRLHDVDYAASVPFDRVVELDIANPPEPGGLGQSQIALWLDRDDGSRVEIFPWADSQRGLLPAQIRLPDPSHPGLAGFTATLRTFSFVFLGFDDYRFRECSTVLAGKPDTIALELPFGLTVETPATFETISLASVESFPITFTPATASAAPALTRVQLDSGGTPGLPPLSSVRWTVDAPPGSTTLQLPPSALPMFGTLSDWNIAVSDIRSAGAPVPYSALYGSNGEAQQLALHRASCNMTLIQFFFVR